MELYSRDRKEHIAPTKTLPFLDPWHFMEISIKRLHWYRQWPCHWLSYSDPAQLKPFRDITTLTTSGQCKEQNSFKSRPHLLGKWSGRCPRQPVHHRYRQGRPKTPNRARATTTNHHDRRGGTIGCNYTLTQLTIGCFQTFRWPIWILLFVTVRPLLILTYNHRFQYGYIKKVL